MTIRSRDDRVRPRDNRPARTKQTPATDPDPVRLAGVLARAWFEIQSGRRPLHQLAPLLSPAIRRRMAGQLAPAEAPPTAIPRIHKILPSAPKAGVREVVVLIDHHERISALAVRMERHRGRWRAVELTAPEAGLEPMQTASLPPGHRFADAFDEVIAEATNTEHAQGPPNPYQQTCSST